MADNPKRRNETGSTEREQPRSPTPQEPYPRSGDAPGDYPPEFSDLRSAVEALLIEHLSPGMKYVIRQCLAHDHKREQLRQLLRKAGATPLVFASVDAYWEMLEALPADSKEREPGPDPR